VGTLLQSSSRSLQDDDDLLRIDQQLYGTVPIDLVSHQCVEEAPNSSPRCLAVPCLVQRLLLSPARLASTLVVSHIGN
jgi:hypothetical protein